MKDECWKCQVSNYKHVNKKKRREKSRLCTEDYKGWKASCQTNNLYLWERWASIAGILCAGKQKIIWLGLTIDVESRCIKHWQAKMPLFFLWFQFLLQCPGYSYTINKNKSHFFPECNNNGKQLLMRLCDSTARSNLIGNLAFTHSIVATSDNLLRCNPIHIHLE